MLHSHPSRSNPANDNDEFSWGDGLVSAISGKIYLSTPGGELYALDRKDAWKVIPTGFIRDQMVIANKNANNVGIPRYLWNLWGALYNEPFIDTHDEAVSGYHYKTFDANSYNARSKK